MAAASGNRTCVKLVNVQRKSRGLTPTTSLYVKGTWFPDHFLICMSDGIAAWTLSVPESIVTFCSKELGITESEYIDKAHTYLSQQQPGVTYKLSMGKNGTVDLMCLEENSALSVGITLTLFGAESLHVAMEMLEFMMDAHSCLCEEVARNARSHERLKAALEQTVINLNSEKLQLQQELHYLKGEKDEERVVKTVGKHKGNVVGNGNGSSTPKSVQGGSAPSYVPSLRATPDESPSSKRASLSGLGWKPPGITAELFTNGCKEGTANWPSLMDKVKLSPAADNEENKKGERSSDRMHVGQWSDVKIQTPSNRNKIAATTTYPSSNLSPEELHSLSPAEGRKRASLTNVHKSPDFQEQGKKAVPSKSPGEKRTGKKQKIADGTKQVPGSSSSPNVNADDKVEKGVKLVTAVGTTPSRSARSTELMGSKASPGKKVLAQQKGNHKSAPLKVHNKGGDKNVEKMEMDFFLQNQLDSGQTDDENHREINVLSADFHDFDENRTEKDFEVNQFWALYDDQDGMPRFYGRISEISLNPFHVSVKWLEPIRPSFPSSWLVKSAGLSASCGEFKPGDLSLQELPAFSHRAEIEWDEKGILKLYPMDGEVWALYKYWDKKQPEVVVGKEKEDDNAAIKFDYDLVAVRSKFSKEHGLKVVPLVKVSGFRTLFTAGHSGLEYWIAAKQLLGRFSHRIPEHRMLGNESPGVPVGSWELDPASTPSEFLIVPPGDHHRDLPAEIMEPL
ncbi:unnamed protein product [Sphagnum tenellum]